MNLTTELQAAIGEEIAAMGVAHRDLATAAAALSRRYRSPEPGRGPSWTDPRIAAYLAARLPATWSAAATALSAVAAARPTLRPRTLLDVGGGPGTVLWAAARVWPGLEQLTVVERDPRMRAAGRRLAQRAPHPAVRDALWVAADIAEAGWEEPSDVVVVAYVLGELPPAARVALVSRLISSAGVLVVVEPGTPEGAARVLAARDAALGAGGHTVAPCPHDAPCPLATPDWCHFAARVNRTKLHRQLKGGQAPYEDEKLSYGAWTREPMERHGDGTVPARVLRHPRSEPGRILLTLCTTSGVVTEAVAARDRLAFRAARKVSWGGTWPPAPDR